jgi:hypothetical protein
VYFTMKRPGGHFPAAEQPTLWVEDFRVFLETLRR